MNKIINSDWLKNDIPDKSIDLIMADPPYFEVKGDFDFIWKSFDDYLKDVEQWAVECKRVLKDNGSLFWWGHAKKIAYSQIIFDKYFNLENHLKWEKSECQAMKGITVFRSFVPVTEHCLFYSNEVEMTGREFIEKEYIAHRNPFAKELTRARLEKGVSTNQVAEYGHFYGNINHGGSVTNWEKGYSIPLKEQWILIKKHLPIHKEYDDLRKEYDDLRRRFNNEYKLSDVIKNSQESNISQLYDHDTIKPLSLITKLIQTTTKEGAVVLIPFGGSGTDVEACINSKRTYICYEIDNKHYNTIIEREKKCLSQLELF